MAAAGVCCRISQWTVVAGGYSQHVVAPHLPVHDVGYGPLGLQLLAGQEEGQALQVNPHTGRLHRVTGVQCAVMFIVLRCASPTIIAAVVLYKRGLCKMGLYKRGLYKRGLNKRVLCKRGLC